MVRRSNRIAALPPKSFAALESSEEEEEEDSAGEEEREKDDEGRLQDVFDDDKEDASEHRPKRGRKKQQSKPKLQWKVLEEDYETFLDFFEIKNHLIDFEDEVILETTEAPPLFLVPLLSHQKEWLTWALEQEESPFRGGLLADEMGMGKTIQVIALVLAKKPIHRIDARPSKALPSSSSQTAELPETRCTLIICPPVCLSHWEKEIGRCTPQGSTKVLVYHGDDRNKVVHDLSSYDFVLTTYQTMFTKYKTSYMARCELCGKWRFPEDLASHNTFYCKGRRFGTDERESEEKLKSSKMEARCASSEDNTSDSDGSRGKSSCTKKKKNPKQKKKADTSSFKSSPSITTEFSLHSIKWQRIILDEAHSIRNKNCYTTRAIFSLKSSYKWALSGTPVQNNFQDLYSLIRFLQIFPYAYYFCRSCDWKSVSIMPEHRCAHNYCFSWWKKYVGKPMRQEGDAKRRAKTLVTQKILKSIMLRRTKESRNELCLPTKIVRVRRCALDIREEEYYRTLYEKYRSYFNRYVTAEHSWINCTCIIRLLTQLQKALNHPYLVIYSKYMIGLATNDQVCGICHEALEDKVVASCKHVFCKTCLQSLAPAFGVALCPACSAPFSVKSAMKKNDSTLKNYAGSGTTFNDFKSSSILNRIALNEFQTSTKIEALREEIRFMVETDGSAKALVFSQFVSFLDLIDYSLQKSQINCVKLVGDVAARNALVSRFFNDSDCRILLTTSEAGGLSLNLSVASYVFLMEPFFSSAVELQACDGVYRIGQHKAVRIVKFVTENTIEERILELQAKKNQNSQSSGLPNLEEELTVKDFNIFFM
ncbi:DNA repair protein RAD16-like isoform X1 [Vitis riparia]|uniref:DNA repair protein RAD16-like isoform X1 n=1 Tax=Vitis riparia TaxID=96939 RepID=UPI00155AE710|nr:DNA repair protein RAD16-like isoform X1 [Vitis riparia]